MLESDRNTVESPGQGGLLTTTNWTKKGLIVTSVILSLTCPAASGAIICDGNPVPVTIQASVTNLSILSPTASLLLTIPAQVGNISQLTLAYSGTAKNGIDFELLPATISIPAFKTSASLIIKPKPNYPFSTKTLTVTITKSANVCVVVGSPNTASITLTGFDPPRVEPRFLNSTNILLEWDAPVLGYVLQTSSTLVSGSWFTVTNAANGRRGTNSATVTLTGSTAFYRLMKP